MIDISVFGSFDDTKSIIINNVPADTFKEIKSKFLKDYHSDSVNKWIKINNILFFKEISKE